MDRHQAEPLTTQEAKMQLREAAGQLGISAGVRRHPFGAMATGVVAGYLAARVPRLWTHLSRSGVGQKVFNHFV